MAKYESCSGRLEGKDDLQELILKTEAVVDDILKPQMEQMQKRQEKVFEELIDVQMLADHIDLLELQQEERLREHRRQVQQLQELHVLQAGLAGHTPAGSSAAPVAHSKKENRLDSCTPVPVEALVNVGSHVYLKVMGWDVYADVRCRKYDYWSVKCSGVKAQIQV
ncbi:unnamed protein product, partial [Rangifer tarandus platyrhynchus]